MANKLLVTFDIKWEDAPTYDRIYNALQEAIKRGLSEQQWWAETTSFYVVETNENSVQLITRVTAAAGMRPAKDKIVAINMNGEGLGQYPRSDALSLVAVHKEGLMHLDWHAKPTSQ